jgi:hypothetical protein
MDCCQVNKETFLVKSLLNLRLSQNFSFWESSLRFRGKSGHFAAFSKAIPEPTGFWDL